MYLLPVWEKDTILDVLVRYFPTRKDAEGNLLAISTPEWTTPLTWIERPLTDASWFNLYLDNLGDGSEPFRDTPARPNSTLLMRYQTDSDRDGYSDRSEKRYYCSLPPSHPDRQYCGTAHLRPEIHPEPRLIAGLNTTREGDEVTGLLAFLNTGNYDAYGVEAIMYAPDQTVSIGNNTIGGSGRVKAASQVVLGSRVLPPGLTNWRNSTARPYSAGSYAGNTDKVFTFTADSTGAVGSTQPITLTWDSGSITDTLEIPAGYQSPLPLAVSDGVEVGFYSGSIIAGDVFTVPVQLPRDTFTYTVQSEPYTPPSVVVSYNDPQGNHRFISSVELADLSTDLAPYTDQMLAPLSLEIATTAPFTPTGSNTTHYVFNLPDPQPIVDGHLFVEYVKDDGTVVAEQVFTQTLQPGPNIIPVEWDTGIFTETYDSKHDYNILALVTDWQGNIIQSLARPLSSFQEDPKPVFAMSDTDLTWDFGTVARGEMPKHTFTLANTGFLNLFTYLAGPTELSVDGAKSRKLPPGDTTTYTTTLETGDLPTGPYDETITIRTSDPDDPTRTVHVTGNIQALSEAAYASRMVDRPLDLEVWVPGDHDVHEWVEFPHSLGPDPQSLHPVKVYSHDEETLWGVGKYASAFASGTTSYDMFGTGRNGDLVVDSGQTVYVDNVRTPLSDSASADQRILSAANTSDFNEGDEVLIIQMQGTGVGAYEFAMIESVASGSLTLARNLTNTYTVGGNSKAQVVLVPHYHDVTVQDGGLLTAHPWNGSTGGILCARVADELVVDGNMSSSGLGYRGGAGGPDRGSPGGYQGEGQHRTGGVSRYSNGIGGGGGMTHEPNRNAAAAGGGGAHRTAGTNGTMGFGGGSDRWGYGATETVGQPDLAVIFLGGGGGGGGGSVDHSGRPGARGGAGGGAILAFARTLSISGRIQSNGANGLGGLVFGAGGGGGGGSVLLVVQTASLGQSLTSATGGTGGRGLLPQGQTTVVGSNQSRKGDKVFHSELTPLTDATIGGNGGSGRIRIEYCETLSGSTSPSASTQKLNCYIVEQVESAPYNRTRLNLPESFTSGRIYKVQYGRLLDFGGDGEQVTKLRVSGGTLTHVMLDALVSNIGAGSLAFKLDVGNDGTWDWETTQTVTGTATLNSPELVAAFTQHTAGQTGDVDVPVKVYMSQSGQVLLTNMVATPASGVDVTLEADDISFGEPVVYRARLADGTPTEGQLVPVQAAVHNNGGTDSGGLTVSFFATAPGWGETLIGVDYLPNVSAGLSATAAITWNTLGFTGTVPVRVYADPFDRVPETDDDNNDASTTFDILTRPDLYVSFASLFREPVRIPDLVFIGITSTTGITSPVGIAYQTEVVVGETYTVTLSVGNAGQSEAGAQTVALYDGNPDAGGTLIGETRIEPLSGISDGPIVCCRWVGFAWTPDTLGPHRLFARVDRDNEVDEFDEGNNQAWRDFYVGFRESIVLDSGNLSSNPAYTPERGYGFVYEGQYDILGECGNEPEQTYRLDPGGRVVYRFDHLSPSRFYHLDLTLYECGQGAGRQESVYVDGGNLVAGPEDLGDGEVHRLSILLDPAFYTDRTITVTVEAHEGLGALVNEIALHDVDYRYADSGGWRDPGYGGFRILCIPEVRCPRISRSYGWLDGSSTDDWGPLPYQTARVDLIDNDVRYQFNDLDPLKRYRVHLTFYQGSGNNRVQQVQIDGQSIGEDLTIVSGGRYSTTLSVPLSHYAVDGSIVVSVVRTNASVGASVNEISLEEETQASEIDCAVTPTPSLSQAYGSVTIRGQPALAGSIITAESTRGDVVGCAVVTTPGQYPFTPIYGEDPTATPPIPGMREGEPVAFRVNGALAVSTPILYWEDNPTPQRVDLEAGTIQAQAILLSPLWNLISFNVEPPVPSVEAALRSITGKFCRVLAETQIYDCTLEEHFRTLRALHGGRGYYVRVEGGASVNLLVEGVSIVPTTPIPLHQGWNWAGYLPSASLPVTVALQSIEGNYRWVHNGRGETYDPTLPGYSRLTEINPGDGIWIYATQPVNLTYPAAIAATAKTHTPVGSTTCAGITPTPFMTVVYGGLTVNGTPAPVDTQVEVVTPRGDVAGCFIVEKTGQYGFMHIYGEDNGAPPLPGFRADEPLHFRVNGVDAVASPTVAWQDDHTPHQVALEVALLWRIHLPTIFKHGTVGP